MKNSQIIDLILKAKPDEKSFKDFLYDLYVEYHIGIGEQEIKEGKVIPHEEVMEKIKNI